MHSTFDKAAPVSMTFGRMALFFFRHGRLPLRERYWRRSDGRLRVRYTLLAYGMVSAVFSFSALSLSNSAFQDSVSSGLGGWLRSAPTASTFIPTLAALHSRPEEAAAPQTAIDPVRIASALNTFRDTAGQIRRSPVTKAAVAMIHETERREAIPAHQQMTIAAGDTLSTLLVQAGVSSSEAAGAINAIRKHIHPGDLRPGQVMNLERATQRDSAHTFNRLTLAIDPVRTLEVKHGWGGFMTARMIEKPLKSDVAATVAVIKGSLYGAASAAGVPSSVTAETIKALGHQIDFQRDIQPGDRLEIMYDRMVTDEGYVARTGGLIFARLYADGRELTIYRFQTRDGRADYFDKKGNSIRKALLRTPMDGARVTSGFGMRRHPILGYSKMHKGIDFGALTGTPIYAAGDGVVDMAGRFGAYGNYVRIRHNGKLKTAYAHLSRYGKGIYDGARVRQGQVIGYVGSTGRSTGPHLHYEIMVNGAQVNPQSVKLPTMVVLEGSDLRKFKETVARLDRQFRERTHGIRYASADGAPAFETAGPKTVVE